MLWAVLAAVGVALLGGGAFYGLKEYRANKPDKIWVPLPLRADLLMSEQKELAENIEAELKKDERLGIIVSDLGLKEKFNAADEDAAAEELGERIFVEVGSADTPEGSVPSINIGVRGIYSENELLREISMRIIRDVWVMIGIDPDTGMRKEGGGSQHIPGGF